MRKILLFAVCIFSFSALNAQTKLLNAISIVVDNEPVTMYELYVLTKQFNISPQDAMDLAIRQKLELTQIKNMNIQIDDFALNQQVASLAARQNMDIQSFYNALEAQGISRNDYRNEVRLNMQRDRLYQYILSTRFQDANEQDALAYYGRNSDEFRRFESFDVIKFESYNSENLENINLLAYQNLTAQNLTLANSTLENITENMEENLTADIAEVLANVTETSNETLDINTISSIINATAEFSKLAQNENVSATQEKLESISSNPRIISYLTQADVGSQTPIFQTQASFVRYFVVAKNNENIMPFEQVKNMIISKIGNENESKILQEYFDTLKSAATITIIRLP